MSDSTIMALVTGLPAILVSLATLVSSVRNGRKASTAHAILADQTETINATATTVAEIKKSTTNGS